MKDEQSQQASRSPILNEALETIEIVAEEFRQRYQFDGNCMCLFSNIKAAIVRNLVTYEREKGSISAKEVLKIVNTFHKKWPNEGTDCDDTDGVMHINTIKTALEEALITSKRESKHTPTESQPQYPDDGHQEMSLIRRFFAKLFS